MITYNIGPGQTYETFTSLESAVVLAPDDIVIGDDNTFLETWTPATSGTDGHQIVLQDAIIDVADTLASPVYFASVNYLSFSNLILKNGTSKNFSGSGNGNIVDGVTSIGGVTGIWFYSGVDNTVKNSTVYQGSSYGFGFYPGSNTVGFSIIDSNVIATDDESSIYAVYIQNTTDLLFTGNNIAWRNNKTQALATNDTCTYIIANTNPVFSNNVFSDYIGNALGFIDTTGITGTNNRFDGTGIAINFADSTGQLDNTAITSTKGARGIYVGGASTIVLNTLNMSGSDTESGSTTGLIAYDTSVLTINDAVINDISGDGISANETSQITVNRTAIKNSGNTTPSIGDAFTAHDTANIGVNFSLAYNNTKTAFGYVGASTGTIYHCTAVNNGGVDGSDRSELYLSTTGVFTIKNSIFMNLNSYPLIRYYNATAHIMDYNCYLSNLASPFFDDASGMMTFSDWVTLMGNETNSIFIHENSGQWDVYLGSAPTVINQILSYCPVNEDGTLVLAQDNPLIDAGITITGVNDDGELDLFGYGVYGNAPNIGASQQYGTSRNLGMPKLIDGLDGVADGVELVTGNLVASNRYEIVTTETNHFGAGVVIGDRVAGLTTALDANNTAKQISPAQGELVIEWMPMFDYDDSELSDYKMLSCGDGLPPLYNRGSAGHIRLRDGVIDASANSINWQAEILYTIKVMWGTNHPTYPGVPKMQIIVTDGTTTWTSSVVDFDGSFNLLTHWAFGRGNEHWQKFKSVKLLKEPVSWV